MPIEVGSTIGDYEVVAILGAGGMGKVYKVRNVISDRIEAMKVLLPDLATQPELADRFLREIKVQASLEHPNIAALHTALRVDNQLVMLMEFVEGTTLEQKIGQAPLPVRDAVDYIRQVLSALEYAHGRGVIHRDIKPANMMLTSSGIVKLMDFGIAKAENDRRLTMTGTTLGSIYYMAPEQIQGLALDARSDLYSVGISLYELVTGKRPFEGDSHFSIMSAHLQKEPPPPITLDPRLPQALNEVMLLSLGKDPDARYQTAAAFRSALSAIAPALESIPARPAPSPSASFAAAQASDETFVLTPTPTPSAAKPAAPTATPAPPAPKLDATLPAQPAPPKQPAAPVAAAAPASAKPVPPPPAPSGSRRTLWMVMGAVAMAVALIAFLQFGPWKGTKAAPAGPAPTSSSTALNPTTANPAPTSPTPVNSTPVSAPPVAPKTEAAHSATPVRTTPAEKPAVQTPTAHSAATQQQPVQQPVVQQQQAPPPQQAPAPVQSTPQQAAPAVNPAELNKATELLAMLGTRANTVRTSLQTLQRSQASRGMNLRGDMQQAATLMNTYLDGANSAINSGDLTSAKDFMSKAERQIEKLEKFLNL